MMIGAADSVKVNSLDFGPGEVVLPGKWYSVILWSSGKISVVDPPALKRLIG